MIDFKTTRLLGHRGARSEALENTLFGFQHAKYLQSRGLAGVEFDVQLTADDQLVVFHDDTLQRMCGLQSRIEQLSLVEIQRHLQQGHKIITLDMLTQPLLLPEPNSLTLPPKTFISRSRSPITNKAFSTHHLKSTLNTQLSSEFSVPILSSFTHIELEIKTHERTAYSRMIRALMANLVDSPLISLPIVLTSFDRQLHAQLQRHKQLSKIPRGLLVKEPKLLHSAPNAALQLGCRQLGIYYPLLTKEMIKYCHRYQLPVSAWTVNDISAIRQLVDWQVDAIITDIPTQLL